MYQKNIQRQMLIFLLFHVQEQHTCQYFTEANRGKKIKDPEVQTVRNISQKYFSCFWTEYFLSTVLTELLSNSKITAEAEVFQLSQHFSGFSLVRALCESFLQQWRSIQNEYNIFWTVWWKSASHNYNCAVRHKAMRRYNYSMPWKMVWLVTAGKYTCLQCADRVIICVN